MAAANADKKNGWPFDQSATKNKLAGVVVAVIEDKYGFIKPNDDLPADFLHGDVYFSMRLVHGVELYRGDTVTFLLRDGSEHKPEAKQVWVDEHPPDWKPPTQVKFQSQGKICQLLNRESGFIRIDGNVPDELTEYSTLIYFKYIWVQCGEMKLVVGDTLTFNISKRKSDEKKMIPHQMKLSECQPRSPNDVHLHIDTLLKKLRGMNDAEMDILFNILSCEAVWKCIGRCWAMEHDTISMLLDLIELLELKSKALPEYFNLMLATFTRTEFCNSRTGSLKRFIEAAWRDNDENLQKKAKQFLLVTLDHFPDKAKMIAGLVKEMLPKGTQGTEHFFYLLLKKISLLNFEDISDFEWNELPLVPSTSELMLNPVGALDSLNHVKTHGPYESVEDYLDTYFRLLRTDCFSKIRTGVQKFLKDELDPRDMNIYSEVSVISVSITERGNGITLGLKVKLREDIEWETSLNLKFGNLLCLSPSGTFKDPIWATIVDRDFAEIESYAIVSVELISSCNINDDGTCIVDLLEASEKIILAESPTYYMAYQPVLKVLQKCNTESLAFQDELVNLLPPSPPQYFDPSSIKVEPAMNEKQKKAFVQALSHRLAIIQGPPGTGKTFIGIHLIKHLLQQEGKVKFPIVILTYKNHALDYVLKAVHSFSPNGVVRVGGRSKERELDSCNLNQLQKDYNRSMTSSKQKQLLWRELNQTKKIVEEQINQLQIATQFSIETLIKQFDVDQVENIIMGFQLRDPTAVKLTFLTKKEVSFLWKKNKEILLSDDLSVEEMINMLDEILVDIICQALKLWMPDRQESAGTVKAEERLSQLIAAQTKGQKEEKRHVQSDSDAGEKDGKEEEKERKAAVWIPQRRNETTVKFTNQQGSVDLGSSTRRLAEKFPLVALKGIHDICNLNNYDKTLIVKVILWYQREEVAKELKVTLLKYRQLIAAIREIDDNHKVSVLQKKQVVGLTITGASIHHNLLLALKPAIIIVEEAAEVMEPQLIAVLGDWVQHLILIGDHKQLRPRVESNILAQEYHLDVSMMERLINNNYPFSTLNIQCRMRPEMVTLLKDVYPELESNLAKVEQNKPPDFLPSMYFWAHEDEESCGDLGFINIKEAERVVKLALLFVQQGHSPNEITILATYRDQVMVLRKMLLKAETEEYPNLVDSFQDIERFQRNRNKTSIKVSTVDSYQGNENKIVIVSLVRSNLAGQIGFVKAINRRTVIQSRAQCGQYFVGNIVTLMSANDSCWVELVKKLNHLKLVSKMIPVHCSRFEHKDGSMISALTAADIPLTGLCKQPCPQPMDCGLHTCDKLCQPFHQHTEVDCDEIVHFLHPKCNHPVHRKCHQAPSSVQCGEPCAMMMDCKKHMCPSRCQPEHSHNPQFCSVKVEHHFPECGHRVETKCGTAEDQLLCCSKVPFRFLHCMHTSKRQCWQREDQIICKELCAQILPCGHPCEDYCGVTCDASKCRICEKKRQMELKRQREETEAIRVAAQLKAMKELQEFNRNTPNPEEKCHCKVLSERGDTASEFYDVRDLVKGYLQPGHNCCPNVTRIEKVINLKLQKKWLEAKTKMFDSSRTASRFYEIEDDADDVMDIINEGFNIGRGGMFGAGIYFATDSSKSRQVRNTASNKLLLCDVLIGKSKTLKEAAPLMTAQMLRAEEYDSLFAIHDDGVGYGESIVYDTAHALPKYIVHYTRFNIHDIGQLTTAPNTTKLQHHHLTPKRNYDQNDPMDMHFRLAESQFLRLKTDKKLKVKSVDYYVNPRLATLFSKKEQDFKQLYQGDECEEILAFHGTPVKNIDDIIKNNFDMSLIKTGLYGAGVYFSEFPDVSILYARGAHQVLLCRLLPGRSYVCPGKMHQAALQDGYDSHIVMKDADGRGWAIVLYNSHQVLPTYVINYEDGQ